MDIKKFEVLLKKINTLKQNLDLSGNEIPELELELLKNYIMELYATISDEEWDKPKKKKGKKHKSKRKMGEEISENVDDYAEETGEIAEEVEMVEEEETTGLGKVEDDIAEEVIENKINLHDPELLSLFEGSSVSELSEKLSLSPIKDLRKAFGLNDKIFTINELFGGDKDLYANSMSEMNAMNNFEDAKVYLLEHVAKKYDWAKKDNQKKAKRFIKIVQRRFA